MNEVAMRLVASSPEFLRLYQNFAEFESDVAGLLYDACEISTFKLSRNVTNFLVAALLPDERRYIELEIEFGTVLNLELTPFGGNNVFVVYISCTSQTPSEVDYDYTIVINATGLIGSQNVYIACPFDPTANWVNLFEQTGIIGTFCSAAFVFPSFQI